MKKTIEYSEIQGKTVLSLAETAVFLGISESLVHALKGKEIPCIKIRRRYVFFMPALLKWLEDKSNTLHLPGGLITKSIDPDIIWKKAIGS